MHQFIEYSYAIPVIKPMRPKVQARRRSASLGMIRGPRKESNCCFMMFQVESKDVIVS